MYGQQIIPRSGDMYICHWYNKLKQSLSKTGVDQGGAKSTIAPGALDPRYATALSQPGANLRPNTSIIIQKSI